MGENLCNKCNKQRPNLQNIQTAHTIQQQQQQKKSNQKMGCRPRHFSKEEHMGSQQAHEKILNITHYHRNANQNYTEV